MLGVGVTTSRDARAQVSDHAQCGTTLPACTTLRTSCCTRDFDSTTAQRAILIPMDRCHQRVSNGGANAPSVSATAPAWCDDPAPTSANAMNRAYGLVYRLMQQKIPVYWIVNPTKGAPVLTVNDNNTNPATTPDARTKDVDFWVVSANSSPPGPTTSLTTLGTETAPVKRMTLSNPGTGSATLVTADAYDRQQFPIRGGAFLIAPDDRAAFDAFHKTQLGRTCGTSGQDCYDFRDVHMYEVDPTAKFVWQDYTQPLVASKYYEFTSQLPVAMRVDYTPPKIALVDGNLLRNFLAAANLDDVDLGGTCRSGTITPNAVACRMSEADVQNNYLSLGGFNWLWLDIGSSSNCTATMARIRTFLTAVVGTYTAGNAMIFDSAIQTFAEKCTGDQGTLGRTGTGLAVTNGAVNETANDPIIVRYPSNLFAQYGDLPLNFSAGSVTNWGRVSGTTNLYNATYDTAPVTLRRLFTQENTAGTDCVNHDDTGLVGGASAAGCDSTALNTTTADVVDMYAYGRYLNSRINGVVFYSPGNNLTPSGQQAQLRMVLSSIIAMPPFTVEQVFTNTEVTRGNPIVATINGTEAVVQGSYEYHYKTDGTTQYQVPNRIPGVYVRDDIAGFAFPFLKGHLRATALASVTTTAQTLAAGTTIFDGANGIPPVSFTGCGTNFTAGCRTVWTTIDAGTPGVTAPTVKFVHEGESGTVGTLMLPDSAFTDADRKQFIQRILKGYDDGTGLVSVLGGIDRSTVAVIGPGASVGSTRPTIAYVGSTDGMLHAFCASVGGACTSLGQELWAYIPRVNLPTLRYNTARIDGSPRVLDVRGTFNGNSTIKTVLLFHTGGGDPTKPGETPGVYALDVTDPTRPTVLWEYTTPAARGAYELGQGLTIAAGDAVVGGVSKNLALVQTNNGGTGGAASVVTALDLDSGVPAWQFVSTYPDPPRLPANTAVPATAIPPGVVTIDKTVAGFNGFFTDIVVPDLYGRLWVLAPDGTSRYQDALSNPIPLFSFATDFHPLTKPAIYLRNGEQYAVFTTGGYADYAGTKSWGSYAANQYLVAVSLDTPIASTTASLTDAAASGFVPIVEPIAGSGYSQARIVGDDIFVSTDTSDVNAATFGTSASATGTLYAYTFGGASPGLASVVVATGAGAIANSGQKLYSSSGSTRQEASIVAASAVGTAVTAPTQVSQTLRKLWLRTE